MFFMLQIHKAAISLFPVYVCLCLNLFVCMFKCVCMCGLAGHSRLFYYQMVVFTQGGFSCPPIFTLPPGRVESSGAEIKPSCHILLIGQLSQRSRKIQIMHVSFVPGHSSHNSFTSYLLITCFNEHVDGHHCVTKSKRLCPYLDGTY